MKNYQHIIGDLRFVMGAKGVFDVTIDGEVLYSKHTENRHADDGEVLERFRATYAEGVPVYGS